MRAYYEDLWERLPPGATAPDLARRRAFLLARVTARDRVLDLGCGAGALTAALQAAGCEVIGVDVAEGALDRARAAHPALDVRLAPEAGALPLADGEVDVVWASEVLEHVADTARTLSEVRRVLRPAGRLLVTTPYHGRVRNVAIALAGFERHADPLGDHLRFYTRRSLRAVLADFGFVDVELTTDDGPPLLRRSLRAVARRAGWARAGL